MTTTAYPPPMTPCEDCGQTYPAAELKPVGTVRVRMMCRWCKESLEGFAIALGLVAPCAEHRCTQIGDEPCVLCGDDDTLYCLAHLVEAEMGLLCKPHAMGVA